MEIRFFCPLWGSENLDFEIFLQKIKAAGYDGVEMSFSFDEKEREERITLIKKYGLQLIAQHWETVDADVETHKNNFRKRLNNLAATKPLFINSQTGKDYYSFAHNKELFHIADSITQETGVEIIHETHRGKWSFAAHITREYLEKIPSLKITFDASHWCNTAETFLEDQQAAIDVAIKATTHIHARVGHTESPQVIDPALPEWAYALSRHVLWWDAIIAARNNEAVTTITPEFGAFPYLVLHPQTNQPLVAQWDINIWMMNYLKNRYSD